MSEISGEHKHVTGRDAFSSVAFWQFMSFILLLCFVWANEIFDLAADVFSAPPTPFNIYRVSILSAAVITAGVITVGHTYERQKAVVKHLLMTCLYCHRVQTAEGKWMHVEEFFVKHYPVDMERGACSECQSMLQSVAARAGEITDHA